MQYTQISGSLQALKPDSQPRKSPWASPRGVPCQRDSGASAPTVRRSDTARRSLGSRGLTLVGRRARGFRYLGIGDQDEFTECLCCALLLIPDPCSPSVFSSFFLVFCVLFLLRLFLSFFQYSFLPYLCRSLSVCPALSLSLSFSLSFWISVSFFFWLSFSFSLSCSLSLSLSLSIHTHTHTHTHTDIDIDIDIDIYICIYVCRQVSWLVGRWVGRYVGLGRHIRSMYAYASVCTCMYVCICICSTRYMYYMYMGVGVCVYV